MPLRLCPQHGPLPANGTLCLHGDCRLPLLRLDGSTDEPGIWKWEACASESEAGTTPRTAERYRREIAALAADGFSDAEIIAWFEPLGVPLSADDVEAALSLAHAR